MAVTEASKQRLFRRLEQVLGTEEASTMMELVPSGDWAAVATTHDVAVLERDLKSDMALVRQDLVLVRHELEQVEVRLGLRIERDLQTFRADLLDRMNLHLYAMAGTVVSSLGLAVAAVKLL